VAVGQEDPEAFFNSFGQGLLRFDVLPAAERDDLQVFFLSLRERSELWRGVDPW
jgi:hypothetical protein